MENLISEYRGSSQLPLKIFNFLRSLVFLLSYLFMVHHMGLSFFASLNQVRDRTLSRIKNNIELMVATNGGKKVVVIPHSMGVLYFLHFMKWVEAPAPVGGGGGSDWCAKHIKAVMNIGGPFLGVPKSVAGLFSIEARDIAVARFLFLSL